MLTIAVVSPKPGAGKTTILVNLGIGLQRKGQRVLLVASDTAFSLRKWLNPISQQEIGPGVSIEMTPFKLDLLIKPDIALSPSVLSILENLYDYLLLDAGHSQHDINNDTTMSDFILACIEAGIEDNGIYELEQQIRSLTGDKRGINLIIPNKARAGEWENNSRQIATLAEHFVEDRIADFIPFCEAIHDLPQEKKVVWDLPPHYNNRKQAFERLVERVLQL